MCCKTQITNHGLPRVSQVKCIVQLINYPSTNQIITRNPSHYKAPMFILSLFHKFQPGLHFHSLKNMTKCFSFTSSRERCFRFSFSSAGLKSATTDLGDGTVIHCWIPKNPKESKPNLVLIHGFAANAMWQWSEFVSPLKSRFNVYVPDLVFFGDSFTTRPDRTESFQAQCVMRAMESHGVRKMNIVGLSYGGFVGYSLAAQFPEAVDRVVIGCAGVSLEEKDMDEGLFKVKTVEEAMEILLAQTPNKMMELLNLSFYKPPPKLPSCFLNDFIDVMCKQYTEERKELIQAVHKDRKLSNLSKIDKPMLIIWGEHDQVFPVELAHRLKRHTGENANLVLIKKAGHALNIEKSKEFFRHVKSFLINPIPSNIQLNNGDKVNHKID